MTLKFNSKAKIKLAMRGGSLKPLIMTENSSAIDGTYHVHCPICIKIKNSSKSFDYLFGFN